MKFRMRLLALIAFPILVQAQVNEEFADLNDAIEMMRSVAAVERKSLITQGMVFSGDESTAFWPVYDEYVMEKDKVNDRLIKIITDYAANYEKMSDEFANQIIDESMDYERDMLKVKSKYLRRFDKVLSPIRLARFYQIENKIDAVKKALLAQQIPLITEAGE
jgi:hypothetical protein